jgi:NADH-quinone oxidoreductase subunit J
MTALSVCVAQVTAAGQAAQVWPRAAVIAAVVAVAATGYWALQAGVLRSRALVLAGIGLLGGVGVVVVVRSPGGLEHRLLEALSFVAITGALAFVVLRGPVGAALGFAIAVLAMCGSFFLQGASFLGAATMIVYAGATIIIFLFVLMFAQRSRLQPVDLRLVRPAAATIIGAVVLAAVVFIVTAPGVFAESPDEAYRSLSRELNPSSYERVVGLGRAMLTDYLLTVELAGALLLVATVGAIAIAQRTADSSETSS